MKYQSFETIFMGSNDHRKLISTCDLVIFLPAHPASFAHNFVSGMQSFYFSESQDAVIFQNCHEK